MKLFIRAAIYLLMFLAAPAWSRGQGLPPESVEVRVVHMTDGYPDSPVLASRETAIMPGSSRCGQLKTGGGTVTNPTQVSMDDPFAGPSLDCVVPMPLGIPDGAGYVAYALYHASNCQLEDGSHGPCMSGYSNYTETFTVATQPQPDPCAGAVVVAVGDWTRTAAPATLGRVLFSLLSSKKPVTLVIVKLDGVETDRLTGSDLRKTAGSYFQLPLSKKAYQLTVEAQDAVGCSDGGAARPMTIVVQ